MGFLAGLTGALKASNEGARALHHTLLDIELRKNEGLAKMYESIASDPNIHPDVRNEALRRVGSITSANPFDPKQRKTIKDLSDTSSLWDLHTTSHVNDYQNKNAQDAAVHGISAPVTPLGQAPTPTSPIDAKPASGGPTVANGLPPAPQTAQGAPSTPPAPQNAVTGPPMAPTTAPMGAMTPAGTASLSSSTSVTSPAPIMPIPELLSKLGMPPVEHWSNGRANSEYPPYVGLKNKLAEEEAQSELQLQMRQRMLASLTGGGGATSARPGSDLEKAMLHQMQLSSVLKESPPQPQQSTVNGKLAVFYGGQAYDPVTNNVLDGNMNRGQARMVFADSGDGQGPRWMSVFSGDVSVTPNAKGGPPVLKKPPVTHTNTRSTAQDPFGFGSSSINSSTTSYGGGVVHTTPTSKIPGVPVAATTGATPVVPPATTPSGNKVVDIQSLQNSLDPQDQWGLSAITNPNNWHSADPKIKKAMGPWFAAHGLPATGPRLDTKQENDRNNATNGLKALDDIKNLMETNPLVGPIIGRWGEAMNKVGSSKLMTLFSQDPGTLDNPNQKALTEIAASMGDKNPAITAATTAQLITRMRALNLREVAALSGGGRGVATLYKSFESAMLQPSQDSTLIAGHMRGLAQEFANVIGTAETARWGRPNAVPLDDETQSMLSKFGVGTQRAKTTPTKGIAPNATHRAVKGPDGRWHTEAVN